MVFNNTMVIVGSVVIMTWLIVLTGLVLRATSHYNRLSEGITKAKLEEVLDAILRTLHTVRGKTETLERVVKVLEKEEQLHIQQIGIARFNPFADTGGAQSFSLAFLDKLHNGIIMTSLYARSGNRWYIKKIVAGKGKELALSKEEESAIENAKYIGKAHHE